MSSKSVVRASEALCKSIVMFRQKVENSLPSSLTKSGQEKRRLTVSPDSLADDKARRIAGGILIEEFANHYKRTKHADVRHFLITVCWDAGVLPVDPPEAPDLEAMRQKVYKMAQKLGLNGVGVFEIAPLRARKNSPPRFLVHVHMVCWTSDRKFKPKAAADALNARGSFPNSFGAPGVTIRSRKMAAKNFRQKNSDICDHLFSDLGRDQTKASLAWLGYYLFQSPAYVKQVCPDKRDPGKAVMRSSYKSYPPDQALALHNLLDDIPIINAVFSVGKGGGEIGRTWRKRFKAFINQSRAQSDEKLARRRRSKAKVRRRRRRALKRLGRDGIVMPAASHS